MPLLGGDLQNPLQPAADAPICLRFVTTAEHYKPRPACRRHENVNVTRPRHVGSSSAMRPKPMQKTALPLIACLLAFAALGAQAQSLWKWRDASGQLHISDTPPPSATPAKDILSTPRGATGAPALSPKVDTPAAPASTGESALDKKKKAVDAQKQQQADKDKADHDAAIAKNEATRKDNCARAQSNLQALQGGQRMAKFNDKGEREILDDSARAAEIKHTQDSVSSNCGPAPAN